MLDAFRCHRSEDQLKHLKKQHKTDVAIIPGGMTSILQPLDVSVSKPFKNKLRDLWTEWMSTGEKSFTKGGRVGAPDLALICKWIVHVWQELDPQIIVHSFVKCCISSALDGYGRGRQPTARVPHLARQAISNGTQSLPKLHKMFLLFTRKLHQSELLGL